MSFSTEIAAAATEAQSILAEVGGARPGQKNSLYQGASYLAVYGQPQVENLMLPAGGYRQRTTVGLTVTRAQFTAPPQSKKQWVRTDVSPPITYVIESVGTHDSLLFHLRLLRTGEGP